jgi:sugar/nucleoside kinase (ribokinase family)
VVHPNDGAACASAQGCAYVPGPFCRDPLISTGAGDNFGAGSVAAALCDFDDAELALMGCCTSGYFVRSGRSPTLSEVSRMAELWMENRLPERL